MSILIEKETSEITNSAKEFLNNHKKMVLSTLGIDGHPNSSLMLYASDGFSVYFGTCKSFGKYKAVTSDPRVSLAVVQENIDPLQVVNIQGIAKLVPESELKEKLAWFTEKNKSEYYVKDAEDFVMFKIEPKSVRWLDAMSGDLKIYNLES